MYNIDKKKKIILASASPRRREILEMTGLKFKSASPTLIRRLRGYLKHLMGRDIL